MNILVEIAILSVNMIFDHANMFLTPLSDLTARTAKPLKYCVQLCVEQKLVALFHFQYFFHCRAEIISPTFYQVNNRD
jgi:hypothetical protein